MKIQKNTGSVLACLAVIAFLLSLSARAHDPVFGIGPHTLFKGGSELHIGTHQEKSGDGRTSEAELQLKYGITADWVAGVGVPYIRKSESGDSESGRGATSLSTKYRFWRNDLSGSQASAAVLAKVIFDNENIGEIERDGNDYLFGITYGYEGRKWYRWISLRKRFNSDAPTGIKRPDKTLLDIVAGIRLTPTEYLDPDWVWMLELNGEITENVNNQSASSTVRMGGSQWFVSPGLMWTYRNFAIKTGVQLPIYDDFRADHQADDYRVQIEFEWHF